MSRSLTELVQAFQNNNRRITRQRLAIFDYLTHHETHPSARQIFNDLRKGHPRISLATVYNTLGALVRLGLIAELDFEALDNRYDTRLEPHLNLVCMRCGSITDREQQLPVAPQRVRTESGFETIGVRFEYRGICAACNNEPNRGTGGES